MISFNEYIQRDYPGISGTPGISGLYGSRGVVGLPGYFDHEITAYRYEIEGGKVYKIGYNRLGLIVSKQVEYSLVTLPELPQSLNTPVIDCLSLKKTKNKKLLCLL